MSLWVSTFSPGITKLVFQSLVVRSLRRYHVQSITLHPCPPIDYLLHADPYSSCQYRCINLYFESFLGDPLGDENLEVEPVNQSGPVPTDGKKHLKLFRRTRPRSSRMGASSLILVEIRRSFLPCRQDRCFIREGFFLFRCGMFLYWFC